MAKNRAALAGKDFVTETIVSFRKDIDTGYYHKVTRDAVRERNTNKMNRGREIISEEVYRLATADDYDEKFGYEDFDGNEIAVYLKEVPRVQLDDTCGIIEISAATEV
jgi:hypothetical protein